MDTLNQSPEDLISAPLVNAETANNVDRIFTQTKGVATDFAREYCHYLSELLSKIDYSKLGLMAEKFLEARRLNRTIFFLGNGGSAATASHFANDMSIGPRDFERPFRCVSLTDNVPILTAIGNDFGYDDIFVLQLKTLLKKDDIVVAISASGNSPNIVKAIQYAKSHGAYVIGLSGFDGGKLASLSDLSLCVKTPKGEYGPVEDLHMVFDHLLGSYLMRRIRLEN